MNTGWIPLIVPMKGINLLLILPLIATVYQRKRVGWRNRRLVEAINDAGHIRFSKLSKTLKKDPEELKEKIGQLLGKQVLSGWFTRNDLGFITRNYAYNKVKLELTKGELVIEKLVRNLGLIEAQIRELLDQVLDEEGIDGLFNIEGDIFIPGHIINRTVESQIRKGKVDTASIAGELNTSIDDTLNFVMKNIKVDSKELSQNGYTIYFHQFIEWLSVEIKRILEQEGRVPIDSLSDIDGKEKAPPNLIKEAVKRLVKEEYCYYSSDESEVYTQTWQLAINKYITDIIRMFGFIDIKNLSSLTRLKYLDLIQMLKPLANLAIIQYSEGENGVAYAPDFLLTKIDLFFMLNYKMDEYLPLWRLSEISEILRLPEKIIRQPLLNHVKNNGDWEILDDVMFLLNDDVKSRLTHQLENSIFDVTKRSKELNVSPTLIDRIINDVISDQKVPGIWLPEKNIFISAAYLDHSPDMTELKTQLIDGNALSLRFLKRKFGMNEKQIMFLFRTLAKNMKKDLVKRDNLLLVTEFSFQCQMCDSSGSAADEYYQCEACHRYLCKNCADVLPGEVKPCPNCGENLQIMPKVCQRCKISYYDFNLMKGFTEKCPKCENPF